MSDPVPERVIRDLPLTWVDLLPSWATDPVDWLWTRVALSCCVLYSSAAQDPSSCCCPYWGTERRDISTCPEEEEALPYSPHLRGDVGGMLGLVHESHHVVAAHVITVVAAPNTRGWLAVGLLLDGQLLALELVQILDLLR